MVSLVLTAHDGTVSSTATHSDSIPRGPGAHTVQEEALETSTQQAQNHKVTRISLWPPGYTVS